MTASVFSDLERGVRLAGKTAANDLRNVVGPFQHNWVTFLASFVRGLTDMFCGLLRSRIPTKHSGLWLRYIRQYSVLHLLSSRRVSVLVALQRIERP